MQGDEVRFFFLKSSGFVQCMMMPFRQVLPSDGSVSSANFMKFQKALENSSEVDTSSPFSSSTVGILADEFLWRETWAGFSH